MKAEDLKTKTADELKKELLDLKKQQFNLRFQMAQGQLANTALIRSVRRDIARVKTVISAQAAPKDVKKAVKAAAPKKAKAETKAAEPKKAEAKKAAPKAKKTTGSKTA